MKLSCVCVCTIVSNVMKQHMILFRGFVVTIPNNCCCCCCCFCGYKYPHTAWLIQTSCLISIAILTFITQPLTVNIKIIPLKAPHLNFKCNLFQVITSTTKLLLPRHFQCYLFSAQIVSLWIIDKILLSLYYFNIF